MSPRSKPEPNEPNTPTDPHTQHNIVSTQYQQTLFGPILSPVFVVVACCFGCIFDSVFSFFVCSPPKPKPNHTKPNQITPNHTKPNQTKPNQTTPNQTTPHHTTPNQTKPNQTKPNHTKPNQTKPHQTRQKFRSSSDSEVAEHHTRFGSHGWSTNWGTSHSVDQDGEREGLSVDHPLAVLYRQLDTDGNGSLDCHEFYQGMQMLGITMSQGSKHTYTFKHSIVSYGLVSPCVVLCDLVSPCVILCGLV